MFQQIQKGLGKAQAIQDIKDITAFLLGVTWTKPSGKGKNKRNPSAVYRLQTQAGATLEIWGCAAINQQVLASPDKPGSGLDPALAGKLVRFKFEGLRKIPGRAQKMKDVSVWVDTSKSIPVAAKTGKPYQLKK